MISTTSSGGKQVVVVIGRRQPNSGYWHETRGRQEGAAGSVSGRNSQRRAARGALAASAGWYLPHWKRK